MARDFKWFNIVEKSDGGKNFTEISIDGIISSFDVSAKDFIAEFNKIQGNDIRLLINTHGGSVVEGFAIANTIKFSGKNTQSFITGAAFSIGAVIAVSAKKVIAPLNSLMLIHQARSIAIGTADDMNKVSEDLKKIDDNIVELFAEKTGKSEDEIRETMKDETLFTGKQAKKFGLVDEVAEELKAVAFHGDDEELKDYKSRDKILNHFKDLNLRGAIPQVPDPVPTPSNQEAPVKNLAELKEKHPHLLKEMKDEVQAENVEATKNERERIEGLQKMSNEDTKDIVVKAIKEGTAINACALEILNYQATDDYKNKVKERDLKNLRDEDGNLIAKKDGEIDNRSPEEISQFEAENKQLEKEAKEATEHLQRD